MNEASIECPPGMRPVDSASADGGPLCFERFEVSAYDYARCIDAGACPTLDQGNLFVLGHGDHPVQFVGRDGAELYCAWQGRRLPSREEWARAATNAGTTAYPWGDDAPAPTDGPARICGLGSVDTCVVGSHAAGNAASGLSDLIGNVAELVFDGEGVCAAGGSYLSDEEFLTPANCAPFAEPSFDVGFRCAIEP